MEDFYGKKFWKIEKKISRFFFFKFFFLISMLEKFSASDFFSVGNVFREVCRRRPNRGRIPLKSDRSELSAAGLAPAAEGGVSASDILNLKVQE